MKSKIASKKWKILLLVLLVVTIAFVGVHVAKGALCDCSHNSNGGCIICDTSAKCSSAGTSYRGLKHNATSGTSCTLTTTCSNSCVNSTTQKKVVSNSCDSTCDGAGNCGCTPTCTYDTITCPHKCYNGYCVECTADSDCSGSTPACDTSQHKCVECNTASDCPSIPCKLISGCSSHTCQYSTDPKCKLTADAGPDRTVCVNHDITFYGGNSHPADKITDYVWDFGDGHSGSGIVSTNTYTSVNDYTVNLTVSDSSTGKSASDTALIDVVPEPATCDACDAHISLSKGVACGNDTIAMSINGIENCTEPSVSFILKNDTYSKVLCTTDLNNGYAACVVKIPDVLGKYYIYVNTSTGTLPVVSSLTINKRPTSTQQLYGPEGKLLEDTNCTDKNPLRMWQDVKLVSLPLHFSFGQRDSSNLLLSSSLNCGGSTYGNFTYGVNCYGGATPNGPDCSCPQCNDPSYYCNATANDENRNLTRWLWTATPGNDFKYYACGATGVLQGVCYQHQTNYSKSCVDSHCTYDTHKTLRTTYSWGYSYDMVNFVSSDNEYIPMFMGYNQTPVGGETEKFTGACSGDNNCYTEVPICGDGVCDVNLGERCWNCPQDCGANANGQRPDFVGHCTNDNPDRYCSRCPTTDPTFSDPRGCVIKFKQRGENATCKAMCDSGLEATHYYYDVGSTPEDRVKTHPFDDNHFVCCAPHEMWNVLRHRCEQERGVIVTDISIDYRKGDPSHSDWCCGQVFRGKNDFGYAKITFKLKNYGGPEDITFKANLGAGLGPRDLIKDFLGEYYHNVFYKEFSKDITLNPGNNSITFIWQCVVTDEKDCYSEMGMPDGTSSPFLAYNITPAHKVITTPEGYPSSIEGLYHNLDMCSTKSSYVNNNGAPYCAYGSDINFHTQGDSFDSLCGGGQVSNCVGSLNPLTGFVADCNPFDNCGCSLINRC